MNTITDLSGRLTKLKVLHDREIHSEFRGKEFPLEALLTISYRARLEQWDERLIAFKNLVNWLSPIVYKPKGIDCYPLTIFVPHSLGEMEYYLSKTGSSITQQDIVECTLLEVLPKMNPNRYIPKPYQDHCIPKAEVMYKYKSNKQ